MNESNSANPVGLSTPLSRKKGWLALSPALLFVLLYAVVSIVVGDFYVMPITVALLAASAWGLIVIGRNSLRERIEIFSRAAGHSDILYMIWIFVMAGSFASLAKGMGAITATVDLTLNIFPPSFMLPAIFAGACFISMSIGTSVGTIVALVPLVVEIATEGGGSLPLYVATVIGGAFFGDNLSFISDTTIAATRTQECSMSSKFRANLHIVLPAAIATLLLYIFLAHDIGDVTPGEIKEWWLVLPYLVIILLAVAGVNVTIVLACGIITAIVLGLATGMSLLQCCSLMGEGIDSMGQLIVITLLASGMLGLIRAMGGLDFILRSLMSRVHGSRGAQACIAVVVALVNLCTANNTIAILTVGPMARDISGRYDVSPEKSASLLDTSSCIVQSLIPYGAQTLLATGLAGISPVAPWPYLYYPWALIVVVIISIIVRKRR